ncbi:Pimeloyl-ACP methyl ester carboxylesterase [Haloechinothrix alba]|uniref:Pimeloyl-ACP methyl ester carboxylesterase n=1 Tax=Haloechinothrix alba TaxID=664784 RepID=A0A238XTZ0_9PSEU|nr:alpha/beta hydrolase [Haloechinothrix alba]SNR61814.1 Pimeloyl-ACP methyl ester carboxylesterase [Haloechinothrix alba]
MAERTDLVEFGGAGPPILLLHGLMGRARTWWQVAQWLLPYGRVLGLDARAHGRSERAGPCSTEDFADDVDELLREVDAGPAVVLGHSMGGLHALVAAARSPELVRAVVVEDMAVDQRGRTVDTWRPVFESWPVPFESLAHVRQFFTPYGDYFTECVEERADGYHLIAELSDLYAIAAEWGEREYWGYVDEVHCPVLVVEAERTAMPEGQQAELARRVPGGGTHIRVPGTGHLVHEDAPEAYRAAVEPFVRRALSGSAGPA